LQALKGPGSVFIKIQSDQLENPSRAFCLW